MVLGLILFGDCISWTIWRLFEASSVYIRVLTSLDVFVIIIACGAVLRWVRRLRLLCSRCLWNVNNLLSRTLIRWVLRCLGSFIGSLYAMWLATIADLLGLLVNLRLRCYDSNGLDIRLLMNWMLCLNLMRCMR